MSDVNLVSISDISSFRGTEVESWITSDGRAYLVQLIESDMSDTTSPRSEGAQTDDGVCSLRGHRIL